MPTAASPPEIVLDLVLRPHRSLEWAGARLIVASASVFALAIGTLFWWLGAWPVLGFLGLDVALLYLALRASDAGARMRECLRLSRDALTVLRRHPGGREECFTFQPYWTRVELDAGAEPGRLSLTSHGRRVTLGAFLAPAQRAELAQTLAAALARLRQPAFAKPASAGEARPVHAEPLQPKASTSRME